MVLSEYIGEAVGGHPWWTKLAPFQEIPSVTVILFDGVRIEASWTHPSELEAELDHWAHDQMPVLGETLTTSGLRPPAWGLRLA